MVLFGMPYQEVISLGFGVAAVLLSFVCFQCKKHEVILIMMTVGCGLWCCHFGFKGLWTPVCMNLINAIRSFVYSRRTKDRWANSPAIPWIFAVISVVAAVLTWSGLWDILTIVGTIVATWATWVTNTKLVKILTVPVSGCWLVYDAVHGSYPGVVNEIFVLSSIAIFFIRTRNERQAA